MIAGLIFLAIALSGAVLLVTDIMFDGLRVWLYSGGVLAVILILWFLRPLSREALGKSSGP
jgi:hypothetical protein